MINLDNNATTPPLPEVIDAVTRALRDHWGNPSSVHRAGQAARREVDLARQAVASLLSVRPATITFTSGATESIDLALRGALAAMPPSKRGLVTTAIEHEAVRDCAAAIEAELDGATTTLVKPNALGVVTPDAIEAAITDNTALVSVQWANNETGALQPIPDILDLCRSRGVLLHTDATQRIGKLPTNLADTPVDLLSCSAHKLHGPKGVGALYTRRGVRLVPRIRGAQELGRRGGTENFPGILGFGAACDAARAWLATDEPARIEALRDHLESQILARIPDAVVNAKDAPRLWNTTNIAFPKLEAEALLLLMSERGEGLAASAGAACSSGSLDPSPILLAMGIPEPLAHGSLRFSLSRFTTQSDITAAADIVAACVDRLRKSSASALGA